VILPGASAPGVQRTLTAVRIAAARRFSSTSFQQHVFLSNQHTESPLGGITKETATDGA
jgi:hypothetical protein